MSNLFTNRKLQCAFWFAVGVHVGKNYDIRLNNVFIRKES
jgi:hypothetical protein